MVTMFISCSKIQTAIVPNRKIVFDVLYRRRARAAQEQRLIEDSEIVKKILKHLGLWDQKARPSPKANTVPMAQEYNIDYTDSQVPASEHCLYVDHQYPEFYTALFLKT